MTIGPTGKSKIVAAAAKAEKLEAAKERAEADKRLMEEWRSIRERRGKVGQWARLRDVVFDRRRPIAHVVIRDVTVGLCVTTVRRWPGYRQSVRSRQTAHVVQ